MNLKKADRMSIIAALKAQIGTGHSEYINEAGEVVIVTEIRENLDVVFIDKGADRTNKHMYSLQQWHAFKREYKFSPTNF